MIIKKKSSSTKLCESNFWDFNAIPTHIILEFYGINSLNLMVITCIKHTCTEDEQVD